MNAAILGLFRNPVDADDITLETQTSGDRGITVDQHQYLDDATIYSGTAAGYAEVTKTEVYVHDHTIETEQVEDHEHVAADYYADVRDATRGGLAQIGISYRWKGQSYVYGTIAASGYVAIYSSMNVPQFGRWLRDELLPYASLPDGGPITLSELTESEDGDEVEVCEVCGREPEKGLEETDAGMLCVVCASKNAEKQQERAEEKLDQVTATDGGQANE